MPKPGVFKRIDSRDQSITPFQVYKSWRFESTSSLTEYNLQRYAAIKPDRNQYTGNIITLEPWQRDDDTGSMLINTENNKEAGLMWYSIDHLFYKRSNEPYKTFGMTDPYTIERSLYDEASIISIPQKIYGEGIKPNSVKLRLKNNLLSSTTMSLVDDGYGNLIDLELSSSITNQLLYLGFNTATYDTVWKPNTLSARNDDAYRLFKVETSIRSLNVYSKNVWAVPNVNLPPTTKQWGNSAYFSGSSYLRIPNREDFNFKYSQDYAVAFWAYLEATSSRDMYLLSKRPTGTGEYLDRRTGTVRVGNVNYNISQFPFEILHRKRDNKLVARASSGQTRDNLAEITGSLSAGEKKHILFQKTGSNMELYLNGQFIGSKRLPPGQTQNRTDLFIGSYGSSTFENDAINGFKGAIDEFFIFNKALNQKEITQLSFTGSLNLMSTNTNIVGNVFYDYGIIVLSDPRPKYGTPDTRMFNDRLYDYFTGVSQSINLEKFYLEFNSTVTFYEHEYFCKIAEGEFNNSMNPSLRLDKDLNSDIPEAYASNPNFGPYITTVGLYSPKGELLAIGKLGTPIKKRNNVDLTIIVRFDV